jgi:hypothetical protein
LNIHPKEKEMKKTIQMILAAIGILVLAGMLVFAGIFIGRSNFFGNWDRPFQMMSPGGRYGNGFGPGMMGSRRNNGFPNRTKLPGMMNGFGATTANAAPLTIDQAYQAAQAYLDDLNNPDLKISEVMIFDNNAYIVVKETGTGLSAFELLVDSGSQVAYPEHGPNMMWNLKYGSMNHFSMMGARSGRMGGMMGSNAWSNSGSAGTTPGNTISPEEAIGIAQGFLDESIPGATAADDPVQFYGYYTLDFEKNNQVAGMLSVNERSGRVFLHTWHGTFIEEKMY